MSPDTFSTVIPQDVLQSPCNILQDLFMAPNANSALQYRSLHVLVNLHTSFALGAVLVTVLKNCSITLIAQESVLDDPLEGFESSKQLWWTSAAELATRSL